MQGVVKMKLIDSQTFLNLSKAFVAESAARNRYEFCEYGFRKNGYEAIATLIDKIAYQEFTHGRMFYMKLQDVEAKKINNININISLPFKEKWDLLENLKNLCQDEIDEAKNYQIFENQALEEGFDEIANLFAMVKDVEIKHSKIFKEIYNQMKDKSIYKKSKEVSWICPVCGYVNFAKEAWQTCPLCQANQEYCSLILDKNLIL